MRTAFFVVILLSCFCKLFSQDTSPYSKLSLVTRPLAWVDPLNQNISLGLQYRVSQKCIVEMQPGIILSVYQDLIVDSFNVHYNGYRVSAEAMFFIEEGPYYVSCEYLYKNFTRTKDEWMLRMGSTYQQKFRVSKYYRVNSYRFKAGVTTNRNGSRVHADIAAGIGLRTKNVSFSPLPEDAEFLELSNFENETVAGISIVPEFFFTISLIYKFRL